MKYGFSIGIKIYRKLLNNMNEQITKKKKILFICDDIRFFSGIAVMARELVMGTIHKYDFCVLAGSVKHPEAGKVIDMSPAAKTQTGVQDAYLKLYPCDGYGNEGSLMAIMNIEKPDALLFLTDPRYFVYLFQLERQIRDKIPMIFWTCWDNLPYPMWNNSYYQSCDTILGFSKQSHGIHKWTLRPENCVSIDGEFDILGNLIKE